MNERNEKEEKNLSSKIINFYDQFFYLIYRFVSLMLDDPTYFLLFIFLSAVSSERKRIYVQIFPRWKATIRSR